jgi:hypothetical protein
MEEKLTLQEKVEDTLQLKKLHNGDCIIVHECLALLSKSLEFTELGSSSHEWSSFELFGSQRAIVHVLRAVSEKKELLDAETSRTGSCDGAS